MTPEDKEFARTCLEKRWLTIEQVEEIKRVSAERSQTFRDVAVAYGLVREKRAAPAPPVWGYVVLGVFAFFLVGSTATLVLWLRANRALELENARVRAALERQHGRERDPDPTPLAIQAERRLMSARESLRYVDHNSNKLPEAERQTRLAESVAGFDQYLDFRPDSAAVLCDRGRARDMLGRLPDALADYEKAMQLDPTLGRLVAQRVEQLRTVIRPK